MAPKSNAVAPLNRGLYLDRPPLFIPKGGMADCRNVRVKEGKTLRDNMGWGKFPNETNHIVLNGTPLLIENFFTRSGGQVLVFASNTDMYQYDESNERVLFITPAYTTGTVDVTNASAVVSGTGTSWLTELKVGDSFHAGANDQNDPSAIWYDILSVDSDTQITLTQPYGEATQSGINYTARQRFTGDENDWWSAEVFQDAQAVTSGQPGDRFYATNGVDRTVAWDTASPFAYFPNLGDFKAKVLRRYKNMLIYANLVVAGDERPSSIRNSAIGEPENVVTKEASEFIAQDSISPINQMFPLGDNLTIYASREITLAQFVGGDTVFVMRTAISGIGPIAGRAVSDFGDFHEFIGPDTQYVFDGITVREIGGHVWRDILRRQSPQRRQLFLSHFDEENGEILWGVPLNGDADPEAGSIETGFVEHYLEDVDEGDPQPYTVRDFPATATGFFDRQTTLTWSAILGNWSEQNYRWNDRFFQAAFPFNLFGVKTGEIYVLNTQDSQNGAAIEAFARFGRRPLGDGRFKGLVKRIYPWAERVAQEGATLTVRLWTADSAAGPLVNQGDFAFDMNLDTTRYFVSPRKIGRYAEVEFRNEGVGKPFELQGYDMDIARAGSR